MTHAAAKAPRRPLGIGLGIVLVLSLTFLAYSPILRNQFTNWDDHVYVTTNESIRELDADHVGQLFRSYFMGNYHPLTLVSIAINYRLSGAEAPPYYLTQILLHLANTLLVLLLAWVLVRDASAALWTAALFGVHTMHVESVAWASARKDVLYALFFFAALAAWAGYRRSGRTRFYVGSLVLFLLSLLAKGMAVALAPTLLAMDVFLGKRLSDRRVLVEKIPFLVLALAFGVVAILAQRDAAAIPENAYASYQRIAFAAYGLVQYAWRLVAPVRLSAIYPYPPDGPGIVPVHFWIYVPIAAALVAGAALGSRKHRVLGFGLVFFLINIALVLQLVPVGDAIMADRYTYVASFGVFLSVGAALAWWRRHRHGAWIQRVVLSLYVLLLALLTYERCSVWRDSLTLWNDVLAKHPHAVQALNNRGDVLYTQGALREAIADYTEVVRLRPNDPRYLYNRGAARLRAGDLPGASADFTAVIRLGAQMLPDAYCGRGSVARRQGDLARAEADYTSAVRVDPGNPVALFNRGIVRHMQGDVDGAIADYDQVLRNDPVHARALLARGNANLDAGRGDAACADLNRATQLGAPGAAELVRMHCRPDSGG